MSKRKKQLFFETVFAILLMFLCCANMMCNMQKNQYKVSEMQSGNQEKQLLEIKQEMMLQKKIVKKAQNEGITVSKIELDTEVDNRINYFISLYGTKEKLETNAGKSVEKLKLELYESMKEQIILEKIKHKLFDTLTISDSEVVAYYNSTNTKNAIVLSSLKQDFERIKQAALIQKQQERLLEWAK